MKERRKLLFTTALISTFVLSIIVLACSNTNNSILSSAVNNSNDIQNDFSFELNRSNHFTVDEIGSWDSPKPANTIATRTTENNNDIDFYFSGTRSLTADGGNDVFIARNKDGWFCNKSPIAGLYKVEFACSNAEASFRFDFGSVKPLNEYYCNTVNPPGVSYTTEVLSGQKTYTIELNNVIDDSYFSYFRYQPISEANNWVSSIKFYYTCIVQHEHTFEHYDRVSPYHGIDGTIEYYECTSCGCIYDSNYNIIPGGDKTAESRVYTLPYNGDAITLDEPIPAEGIVTVDVKLDNPSGHFVLKLMQDWSNYVGYNNCIDFNNATTGQLRPGIKVDSMTDGWLRLTLDFDIINAADISGTVTQINKLYVEKLDSTTGALAEMNSEATNIARGQAISLNSGFDINVNKTPVDDITINVEIYFTSNDDTRFYVSLLDTYTDSSWNVYYGYYSLYPTTKTGDYEGLTVTYLPDGYIRYSFLPVNLNVHTETIPNYITKVYGRPGSDYSTASGYVYVNLDAHEHTLTKHDAVSPFRENDGNIEYYTCSECGKILDEDYNEITLADTVVPSRLTRYEAGVDKTITFDEQIPSSEILTIDYKADDANETTAIALMETDGWDSYYGYYSFYGDGRTGDNYKGVSVNLMDDGYYRITFNLSELNKIGNKANQENTLTGVKWVYVRGDWTHTGGYIDCNVDGGQVLRGSKFNTGKDLTINFDKTLNETSTVYADILWLSDETTHVNVAIGDWDNYKGYFRLTEDTKTGDYAGLVVTKLSDNYIRYEFTLNQCIDWVQGDKTRNYININHIYIRGGWSTAEGYLEVSYIENLDSPVVGDIY